MLLVSWHEMGTVLSMLAERIRHDGVPNTIVGLQRGGLIPAVVLSHLLGIRDLYPLNITRTISDEIGAAKRDPLAGPNICLDILKGRDVLLVDDVVGSGETLRMAQQLLLAESPRRVRTLVCYANVAQCSNPSGRYDDLAISYVGHTIRAWVVFPWEVAPSPKEQERA